MYFEKKEGRLKGDFSSLKNGKYLVKEISETRSQAQNRLYYKWITDLVGEFTEKGIFITSEDLHEGLKDKLIAGHYKKNKITGRRVVVRKTTTKLSKKEFSLYIENIEKYLLQTFEISHPLPGDFFY